MKKMAAIKNYVRVKLMGGLDGNALVCSAIEPLWSVAFGMIFYYLAMYMDALGISEVQMGFINSLGAVLATGISFLAGPITDKLGRKKASLYFDLVSWTAAMIVWSISQNFWFFLAAAMLNAFVKIPTTSWTCLSIEDTSPDKRAVFFSFITIVSLGSGIFTPITGVLIDRFGVVAPMRFLFAIGCLSMTIMFFVRNHYVKETEIGKMMMLKHESFSTKDVWRDYKHAMKYMVTNKLTLVVLMILLLTNFQLAFQFFLALYLKSQIGLSAFKTSMIPGLAALVNLIIYFAYVPRLIKKSESKSMLIGISCSVLGSGLFLFVVKGGYVLLVISTILTAAGNLIMMTFRDSLWNNVIGEGERAKIFAASQGLISIIAIPSGIMAGYLYQTRPILPFVASFVIFTVTLVLSVYCVSIQTRMFTEKMGTVNKNL
jgi:MFS family permease